MSPPVDGPEYKAEKEDHDPQSPSGAVDPEKAARFQSAHNTTDDEAIPESRQEIPLQKWNEPRVNIFRFFATLYSFIILGMNDGVMGVSTKQENRNTGVIGDANKTSRRCYHMYDTYLVIYW